MKFFQQQFAQEVFAKATGNLQAKKVTHNVFWKNETKKRYK